MLNKFSFCLLFIVALAINIANAQDKIITNDDRIITAYNTEVSNTTVFYTVTEDINSETKRLSITEIAIIKKSDGSVINPSEVGENNDVVIKQTSSTLQPRELSISEVSKEKNRSIIEGLNKKYEFIEGAPLNPKKKTQGFIRQYGVSENSILETDELSMGVVIHQWNFKVWVKNKTDKILYVDLGNAFYSIFGEPICAYVPTVTNVSNSSSGGGSVNLGGVARALGVGGALESVASGVSVGGGSGKTITETTLSQRVIAIPPQADKMILEKTSYPSERLQVIRNWSFKGDTKWGITYKGEKQNEGHIEEVNNADGYKEFSIFIKYHLNENLEGDYGVMKAEFFPIRNLYCYDGHEMDSLIGENVFDRYWIRFWGKAIK